MQIAPLQPQFLTDLPAKTADDVREKNARLEAPLSAQLKDETRAGLTRLSQLIVGGARKKPQRDSRKNRALALYRDLQESHVAAADRGHNVDKFI